jgi:CPA1 family monovalent cation:H+ antiporter
LALGVAVTFGINYAHYWLSRRRGEESGAAILVNLLTPFGAYLAAEQFHASGILAAVAAGITMSYIELSGRALATTRIQRTAVWDTVRFTLNGLMFVLLGEQLPAIVSRGLLVTEGSGQHFNWWLPVCALVIAVILAVLRYVWMWMSLRVLLLRASLAGREVGEVDSRIVPVMSLAGVRGAVTLAAVLSLPLLLKGSPFPGRDQAIFLAAAVILISLVGASVLLPRLLRGQEMTVPDVSTEERKEEEAIREASGEAIKAVERASHALATANPDEAELYAQVALRVMERYQQRFAPNEPYAVSDEESLRVADRVETELRQVALKAERETFFRLARAGRISDETSRRLKEPIDLAEESIKRSVSKRQAH